MQYFPKRILTFVLPIAVACLFSGAFVVSGQAQSALQAPGEAGGLRIPSSQAEITMSFAPIVRRVGPAVVNVYAKQIVRERSRSPFFNDPFFRRFFNREFGIPRDRERVSKSLGSGAIVSSSGIVVTNHHVIKDSTDIRVALADKREFAAEVLLKDERSDLAILMIVDSDLRFPHLEFADSDQVEIGDLVLAVGNPFGIGQTVTSGIVSALARTQVGAADYRFFIQTDAAINPGNSGGPLIDLAGRVIGVNTAIFSRSGGSNGIGFAIPSNMVRLVAETAAAGKELRRPWVGARFQPLTPDLGQSLGLDRPAGALVTEIVSGSPIARAGLKPGDVITNVGEFVVEDPQGLRYRLTTLGLGKVAELIFLRNGRELVASLALEVAPEDPPRNEQVLVGRHSLSGAKVANLSPAVAEELDLSLSSRNPTIIITGVTQGSQAARVGLQTGDIVLGIDGLKVPSVKALRRALDQVGQVFELVIRRGGKVITTKLRG